jgi:hypothetical protein
MIKAKLKITAFILFLTMEGGAVGNFTLPIWHPDARWATAVNGLGSGATGQLDGTRLETMSAEGYWSGFVISGHCAGPYGYLGFDSLRDRVHLTAGSGSRGYLDGPFSRARMASISYTAVRSEASYGKQYYFFSEPQNGHKIRRMDFVNQEIRTVASGLISAGMTVDSAGRLYVKSRNDSLLHIISMDGTEEIKTLDIQEGTGSTVAVVLLVLDEKKGRLYAASAYAKSFYVYYWDLADGSFHGVLPVGGTPLRDRDTPGPFEGTNLYNQIIYMYFGPDDPDKRYLYICSNDSYISHRLDLQDRIIWAGSVEGGALKFISSGIPKGYTGPLLLNDAGDFTSRSSFWDLPRMLVYKRIN